MAANLLGLAAQQEAIFQLTIDPDRAMEPFRYLVCRGVQGNSVVLACRGPNHDCCKVWEKQEFPFRFLLQTHADKFPRLHKFQGRITEIHSDLKTITVAMPASITVLEQRRNIRLKLHRRHLPGLSLWGVAKSKGDSQSRLVEQQLLLDLPDAVDEMQALLKNVSAGGMRLALPRPLFLEQEQWLEKGCRLLARLTFPGQEPDQEHAYEFIGKVSNTRVPDDAEARPEVGVQFLSSLGKGLQAHWRDVRADGCLELLKLLQSYQLEYYRDLKKNLIMREGSACNCAVAAGAKARGKRL
ncbi:PilZ domain-containing protein [Solidesulfovibrio sp.]